MFSNFLKCPSPLFFSLNSTAHFISFVFGHLKFLKLVLNKILSFFSSSDVHFWRTGFVDGRLFSGSTTLSISTME